MFGKHAGVRHIYRHFIRFNGISGRIFILICYGHFTQREITQRTADSLIISDTVVACQICQINIIHQLAQPRCIGNRYSGTADRKRILSRIPVLRVYVRICSRTHISHTTATGVRGNTQRVNTGINGIKLILVLGKKVYGQESYE